MKHPYPTSPNDADVRTLLSGLVDRRRGSLYWRVKLKAGVPTPHAIECFTHRIGDRSPYEPEQVLTWVDTNMLRAQELPAPYDIVVERLMFLFHPLCPTSDCAALMSAYSWAFRILEKWIYRQPLLCCSAVGRIEDLIEKFGQPDKDKPETDLSTVLHKIGETFCFELPEKLYIPPLCQFGTTLTGSPITLERDLDFYILLDGIRDYPVA